MTLIDLCNEALDLVGASTITSMADGSPEANVCQRVHGPVIDRVLRSYPWNCAQMRALLTPLATEPAHGFSQAFELPASPYRCLRVLEVGGADTNLVWKVESLAAGGAIKRVILCDAPAPLPITYIRRITDPDEFDPLLAEVIIAELALRLTAKLTESASKADAMRKLAQDRYQTAVQVDAREQGAAAYTQDAGWLGAIGG